MNEKDAVLATLEDYAEAYCAKDIDALMQVFEDNDEISLIGTGADELCSGREQARALFLRNFSEASAHRFEWHWSHISVFEMQAVVASTLTIHLTYQGQALEVPVRWTVALKKINQKWLWIHRHASAAATSQDEGCAYPKEE